MTATPDYLAYRASLGFRGANPRRLLGRRSLRWGVLACPSARTLPRIFIAPALGVARGLREDGALSVLPWRCYVPLGALGLPPRRVWDRGAFRRSPLGTSIHYHVCPGLSIIFFLFFENFGWPWFGMHLSSSPPKFSFCSFEGLRLALVRHAFKLIATEVAPLATMSLWRLWAYPPDGFGIVAPLGAPPWEHLQYSRSFRVCQSFFSFFLNFFWARPLWVNPRGGLRKPHNRLPLGAILPAPARRGTLPRGLPNIHKS